MLELPGRPLKCLLLENNPDIGDSCLDELFVSLNKGSVLETLSLSGCCIGTCQWARYLPFIGSLRTLDLSYNQIGDSEFGVLCKALETCYCLRHLDLAFNRFWGTNCNVIEQMVASNGALQTLSLKGNRCADSVWTALHRGMLLNKTLLNLNLSDCDITMVNAKEICKLFEMNDICSIDFSNNPLPVDFILSPREQTMQNVMSMVSKCQPVDGGGGGGRVAVLPLSPHAHVLSIALSEQWCAARARQVELSLNSLCIVADRQHVIPQKEERSEYFPASSSALITPNSISASQDGSAEQTNTATYSSHRGSSIGDASTNMARGPQALTRPGTIALSELYLSPAALRAHVLESELANTAEPRVMHVAYGRAALLIGHIDITSLTTFAEARLLVHPLVQEYVSTILLLGASPEVHGDLVSKYSLMDPAGLTLTDEDAKVCPICAQYAPCVFIMQHIDILYML